MEEEWLRDLAKGTTDAQITLILHICPNIRTLLFERHRGAQVFIRFLFVLGLLFNAVPGGHYPRYPAVFHFRIYKTCIMRQTSYTFTTSILLHMHSLSFSYLASNSMSAISLLEVTETPTN